MATENRKTQLRQLLARLGRPVVSSRHLWIDDYHGDDENINLLYLFSEWYWECFLKQYFLKGMAIITGIMSVAVVWSEMTFFCKKPVLSVFANVVIAAGETYNYAAIVVSIMLLNKYRIVH